MGRVPALGCSEASSLSHALGSSLIPLILLLLIQTHFLLIPQPLLPGACVLTGAQSEQPSTQPRSSAHCSGTHWQELTLWGSGCHYIVHHSSEGQANWSWSYLLVGCPQGHSPGCPNQSQQDGSEDGLPTAWMTLPLVPKL